MKLNAWTIGLFYAILIIFFKIYLFQYGLLASPIGRLSNIIMYLGIIVFAGLAIFLAKRNASVGDFGLKAAIKTGLSTTAIFCLVYSVFNYFFFRYYLIDFYINSFAKEILKEGKTLAAAKAQFSIFMKVTSEIFGIIGFGGLGSVLMSMLIGRK